MKAAMRSAMSAGRARAGLRIDRQGAHAVTFFHRADLIPSLRALYKYR